MREGGEGDDLRWVDDGRRGVGEGFEVGGGMGIVRLGEGRGGGEGECKKDGEFAW